MRKLKQLITSCLSEHTPNAKWSLFKVRKANAITSNYWCMKYVVIFAILWNATWFGIAFGCILWLLRLISRLTAHSYYSKTNTRFSAFLMILLMTLLWDMFKRVYVTFLEWYLIIYLMSTEIRQLTTILKFCPKICFLYIVCKPLCYDSSSWFCQVRETIEFGPSEISRLTEHMWP